MLKRNNIHTMGIPEGKEKEKGTDTIFKATVAKNFPNLGRKMDTQIHKAQRIPIKYFEDPQGYMEMYYY